MQLTVKI